MWCWWKYKCSIAFGEQHQNIANVIKIGVQLAIDYRGTIGVVARNDQGEFMGGCFRTIPSVSQVIIAEALAVREGMELAAKQGWCHLDVESDSQTLIKAIVGEFTVPLEIDVVVEDIRTQGRLLDATFRYVRRGANNVAHLIAH
ncbi:hypothetical protein LIER_40660 [Lithospermum erythrorhizon]|uniref:RNase H type-1 domain-containing protein n=1 Tax=Lithospermum erythrorhizon TaxID=34254 RepID=A0AAV3QXV3_LITER